ncbi:MAG: hypothetical protein JSR73_12145 [Proteobacteria bacterium]|nr:hypothetical protein [Pseudomonadota bacterium]
MNPAKTVLPTKARPGWLTKMDQRSALARALLARLSAVEAQLGELTPIERSLAERWIHMEAMTIRMETDMRDGKDFDVGKYLATIDRLHGLARTLGLKRRANSAKTLAQLVAEGDE